MQFVSYALLVCGALLIGCDGKKPAAPQKLVVRVSPAQSPDAAKTRARSEYLGILRADVETLLSFKAGGTLACIGRAAEPQDWQEGTRVATGEVLARLQEEDFVSSVKATRAKCEADAQQYTRIEKLHAIGAISQRELESTAAAKLAAEAALAQAEQAVKDAVLLAPYDGTISARLSSKGETILAGKTVLKIADMRQMSVELGIPDRVIGRIHVGDELPVRVSALEAKSFTGQVSEVGVTAKEGARLFRVVIKLKNPAGELKSGMTASVATDNNVISSQGSVLIPLSALVSASKASRANQLAVFVVDADSKAHERPVKTDDLVRSSILVTEGLQPGEKVVTAGASTLCEGMVVDARQDDPR